MSADNGIVVLICKRPSGVEYRVGYVDAPLDWIGQFGKAEMVRKFLTRVFATAETFQSAAEALTKAFELHKETGLEREVEYPPMLAEITWPAELE